MFPAKPPRSQSVFLSALRVFVGNIFINYPLNFFKLTISEGKGDLFQ
jgi:hypothetical protein